MVNYDLEIKNGWRKASDLLSINDNRFLTVYNSVKREIINKMYGNGLM